MDIDFSSTKPDARVLILQIILISVMSFSMQNILAMMTLFIITDILCAVFLGIKEAGKNLVTYSLLWALLYALNILQIPVISLIFPMFMMLMIRVLPPYITCLILIRRTPMNELMASLGKLHIPMIVLIPVAVMYRYLPTVGKEITYVRESLKMRGLRPSVERFFVPLLFRSEKISEELSAATICKGLDVDRERTCLADVRLKTADYLYGAVLVVGSALLYYFNYLLMHGGGL